MLFPTDKVQALFLNLHRVNLDNVRDALLDGKWHWLLDDLGLADTPVNKLLLVRIATAEVLRRNAQDA